MESPVQTAFAVLKKDHKVLLIQEGKGGAKGLWSLPGGHLDELGSAENAAAVEVKEEAGYEVKIKKLLFSKVLPPAGYYARTTKTGRHQESDHEVNIFLAEIIGGQMKAGREESDIGWFSFEEIKKLPLRWKWLPEFLENNKIINNLL